ncbi:MAG: hypothetical protein ACRD30_06670 [Bryobacteraceae bacterium]
MTDWEKIAAACEPGIPAADVEKIAPILDALEAAFRPLCASIPEGAEMWSPEDFQ